MIKIFITTLILINAMTTQTQADPVPLILEEIIPFAIQISDTPPKLYEPIKIDVYIYSDRYGEKLFRWCVMEGKKIQFEFETFDDLYYLGDGPSCFMVRLINEDKPQEQVESKRWHVCLK